MSRFRKYGCCYMAAGIAAVFLKICYSRAGSDELLWILAPVVWWIRVLSGITYEYLPGVGYVNHTLRFVVAPSCSGVQFLVIAVLMLVFSLTHRMGTVKKGMVWVLGSAAGAYLYTIFVNGIRIVLSIYIPQLLLRAGIGSGWLTQKRLHTIIGTAVYFISLLILYRAAEYISRKMAEGDEYSRDVFSGQRKGSRLSGQRPASFLPPVVWYYFIVLGIPFLNRAWSSNRKGFIEYAFMVTGVCLPVLVLRWLTEKAAGTFRR